MTRIPDFLIAVASAIFVYIGYAVFSSVRSYKARRNPAAAFKAALDKLITAGIKINPDIRENDIFDRWTEKLTSYSPIEALYITLGDSTQHEPYTNFSDNCWHFDQEVNKGKGAFANILENLKRISNGDLGFQNIIDHYNDDEDNKAWISFELYGDKYKWDLDLNDDWVDSYLFDKIHDLCRKYNKDRRLAYFSAGQGFVISYLTADEFVSITEVAKLKLRLF